MTAESLKDQLRRIVGESGILSDNQINGYVIDDIIPKAVVVPTSVMEIQDVLSFAAEKNLSVIPAGNGTKLGIGNIPSEVDLVLSTRRLNRVIEYEPADLTVTVETGMRLVDLQKELAVNRQFLPMNPSYADRCTIGGIVSSNSSGPLRLQYGTSRNLVLGMKVVLANGKTVKCGGKVVKNVAGYDLNRLYIGSYGTLGIITEVSLKLSPLPVQESILVAQYDTINDAVKAGMNVVRSQTLPSYVILLTKSIHNQLSEVTPTLFFCFGGDAETVSWQLNTTQSELEQNGALSVQIIDDASLDSISHDIQEYPAVDIDNDTIVIKVQLKRTDFAEFVRIVQNITSDLMILLGNGLLYMRIGVDASSDYELLADSLTQLRKKAMALKGNLLIEAAPPELKRLIDIWGPIGHTLNIMKKLKTRFDSKDRLNPGRYVSSI